MKYHFIGVCGAGMSAVAKLLIEAGHSVTGSDANCYPPIADYLVEHGIPCVTPYNPKNIPEDAEVVVIGKTADLIPEKNEEVHEAFALQKMGKVKILSFPQVLEVMTADRNERIVVAGSFGKSSCTALVAWCLEQSGVDTGYFIGASPKTPLVNAHVGTAAEFVFEGDEYPAANWDAQSKFMYYHPKYLLLTALAHDHVNVYPTHEAYIHPFMKLIAGMPHDAVQVVCVDDETIQKNITSFPNVVTYGLSPDAMYTATNIQWGGRTSFTITCNGAPLGVFETSLLGKHNIQNIVGCVALLVHTKKITIAQAQAAVARFESITRRLDVKSTATTIPVYEGFGTSYDKARAAIDAIQLHFPNKELLVVFEPHTFSWRNRDALHWYDTVFTGVSKVYVYKPPTHGAQTHNQSTHDEIIARIQNASIAVVPFTEASAGVVQLQRDISVDAVVLILSSGDLGGFIPQCVTMLEREFPKHS